MRSSRLIARGVCLLLAVVLLLLFCSVAHDCHGAMEDQCPVCLVLSAWKWALPGALALACFAYLAGAAQRIAGLTMAELGEKATLVALKVKLSD